MSNLLPIQNDLSRSLLPVTQGVVDQEPATSEHPHEDPCTLALVLLNSMASAMSSLKEESAQTMLSLREACETLGQRYQALSLRNETLRTRLANAVHAQHSKMARYAIEIATLKTSVKTAKTALQTTRELSKKIPAGIQNKLQIATLNKKKAILEATQAGQNEILRLKKEYGLMQAVEASSTTNLFIISRCFEKAAATYKTSCSQLELDSKEAAEAYDKGLGYTNVEEFREGMKRLRKAQLFSYRLTESLHYTYLLARLRVSYVKLETPKQF